MGIWVHGALQKLVSLSGGMGGTGAGTGSGGATGAGESGGALDGVSAGDVTAWQQWLT